MAYRRQHRDDDENPIIGFIAGVIGLYILYLVYLYTTNRTAYWYQFIYFVVFVVFVLVAVFAWRELSYRWRERRLNNLLSTLRQNDLESYVKNFIDRFGMQKGKKGDWTYRGYSFDWERLKDFRKVLNERGMSFYTGEWDNRISIILRHYIQEREERVTRDSVAIFPKKFLDLSGSEFEGLLYRLFGAMGYSVQKTGQVGDQGCDLVVNMNNQRVVVQAKRYTASVGNAAVQQAVAAQKLYGCNKSMVVSNASFTKEAVELAKTNDVDLVDGRKLSEMLMEHLKESWG